MKIKKIFNLKIYLLALLACLILQANISYAVQDDGSTVVASHNPGPIYKVDGTRVNKDFSDVLFLTWADELQYWVLGIHPYEQVAGGYRRAEQRVRAAEIEERTAKAYMSDGPFIKGVYALVRAAGDYRQAEEYPQAIRVEKKVIEINRRLGEGGRYRAHYKDAAEAGKRMAEDYRISEAAYPLVAEAEEGVAQDYRLARKYREAAEAEIRAANEHTRAGQFAEAIEAKKRAMNDHKTTVSNDIDQVVSYLIVANIAEQIADTHKTLEQDSEAKKILEKTADYLKQHVARNGYHTKQLKLEASKRAADLYRKAELYTKAATTEDEFVVPLYFSFWESDRIAETRLRAARDWKKEAEVHRREGRYTEAAKAERRAAEMFRRSTRYHLAIEAEMHAIDDYNLANQSDETRAIYLRVAQDWEKEAETKNTYVVDRSNSRLHYMNMAAQAEENAAEAYMRSENPVEERNARMRAIDIWQELIASEPGQGESKMWYEEQGLQHLAMQYRRLGQYQKTIDVEKDILRFYSYRTDFVKKAEIMEHIADDYRELRKYSEAAKAKVDAAEIYRRIIHNAKAENAEEHAAELYERAGQFAQAAEARRRAARDQRRMNEHGAAAELEEQVAEGYRQIGQKDEALNAHRRAITDWAITIVDDPIGVVIVDDRRTPSLIAYTETHLAMNHRRLGQNLKAAMAEERAAEIDSREGQHGAAGEAYARAKQDWEKVADEHKQAGRDDEALISEMRIKQQIFCKFLI